jgi:hypothetical protein
VNPRGKVRIIAGEYRGRRIPVAQKADLRPTPDRVRETLFNWLGQWLDGLACLDLFAGSGALGFEAASRGAARVVMVESDGEACKSLQDSAPWSARRPSRWCAAMPSSTSRARKRISTWFPRSSVQAESAAGDIPAAERRQGHARVRGVERAFHARQRLAGTEALARRPGELPALRMEKR